MTATSRPIFLLVIEDATERQRWCKVLEEFGEARCAGGLPDIERLPPDLRPDICAVDLDLKTQQGDPLLVAVRGIYGDAEIVGIGAAPEIQTLVTSVNEGHMRRFVALDACDGAVAGELQREVAQRTSDPVGFGFRAVEEERSGKGREIAAADLDCRGLERPVVLGGLVEVDGGVGGDGVGLP